MPTSGLHSTDDEEGLGHEEFTEWKASNDLTPWSFPGMAKGFKYEERYSVKALQASDPSNPLPTTWNLRTVLRYLDQGDEMTRVTHRKELEAAKGPSDVLKWVKAYPEEAAHFTSAMVPLAHGYISYHQTLQNTHGRLQYFQDLSDSFGTLWKRWANLHDEVIVSHDKNEHLKLRITSLKGALNTALDQLDPWGPERYRLGRLARACRVSS
jgi:hypothetical protein